jgi:hypothetical protein
MKYGRIYWAYKAFKEGGINIHIEEPDNIEREDKDNYSIPEYMIDQGFLQWFYPEYMDKEEVIETFIEAQLKSLDRKINDINERKSYFLNYKG